MLIDAASIFSVLFALLGLASLVAGQTVPLKLYDGLEWRMIGPFRGGRTVGAAGVPSQPGVYYMGVNNGGVWKTNDFGRTWNPIFDDQPTGSIGTLAVAPSDPNTIYVGSGEGLPQRPDLSTGDGVYRSNDAGKTWKHLGLRDGQQIGAILIDPHDAKRLFVAVVGHPYGPSEERGVFRSVDGGETFQKVLYKNPDTGAIALAYDPNDSRTIYADLYSSRQGPWENGTWQGPGSGLYKSTDGGSSWRQLTKGLPGIAEGLGRIGVTVAASEPTRLYALVDARDGGGLYRSDDSGESWRLIDDEDRIWGRGSDFAEVKVDPKNPETVYIANTSTYKSTDGGRSFYSWKGAPGGDDYHTIWIDPNDPKIILLALDQGATLTVNGGETWTSWYNQPTAQFYHVATDNQFPYWVYGGQQESGSAGVASRGNDGQITFREWHPVGAEEYGYVAPDPLHPNIIYGGKVSRYDTITGQNQNVSPQLGRGGKLAFLRTAPLLFSTVDPHLLFLAGNVVFKTSDGGNRWQVISPDLSREVADPPLGSVFKRPARRGVIYTVAPSYKDVNVIWAGTDDGLIHVTKDGGKTWKDVTPKGLTAWSKVSIIDGGRFDANTAYAAVSRFKLDDLRPHIYRTHDSGETWTEVVSGLPDNAIVDSVREDTVRKGLLFCGTENAAYFSIDDGDHWNPLRLNMPATAIRDLVVHDDDLVVGTHGRSFWILDDITPLRQIVAGDESTQLFKPEMATRVHWNNNTDTPLPPEEPAGKNPPDGAFFNYYLNSSSTGPIKLEVVDAKGGLVRRYASDDKLVQVEESELQVPMYWIRPLQPLLATPGFHRFVWDLRYTPLGGRSNYPIAAIFHDTAPGASSPWVAPGRYEIRLIAGGHTYSQFLNVRMDPRIKTPVAGLNEQFRVAHGAYVSIDRLRDALGVIDESKARLEKLPAEFKVDISAITAAFAKIKPKLAPPQAGLSQVMALVEESDAAPTSQAVEAFETSQKAALAAIKEWDQILATHLTPLNAKLKKAGLPEIPHISARTLVPTGYGGNVDEDEP